MSKKKRQKLWAVADCETDAFDGLEVAPFVWAIITSEGERRIFWKTAELVEFLQDFDGICYAHNGGKFDWLMPGIIEYLDHGDIKIINSRLAKAKLGKCELRDSFLCLPSPLAKFGGKLEFDYEKVSRKNSHKRQKEFKNDIETYLIADVVALFAPMERFIQEHGFALTQAGAALKTWEEMGGEKRRYGKKHDDTFRPFYFGGRCQVFEYGAPIRGNFSLYDVTSMYPAAMCDQHPCGTDYYVSTDYKNAPGWSFWKVHARSYGAFARRNKNATEFPDDAEDVFFVTGWELRAALDTDTVTIYSAEGYIPRRTETLAPYVNKFFAAKAEADRVGDKAGREIAKIFLNSLYGKYGSNPANYYDYKIIPAGELYMIDPVFKTRKWADWEPHLLAGDYDIIKRPCREPQYFDVALAASVTGWSRALLWRTICASRRPLYCDTDSLLCEKFGGNIGENIGEWKHEEDVIAAYIAGKKLYAFNTGRSFTEEDEKKNPKNKAGTTIYKTAHKGVSSKDIEVEDIIRVCKGEIVEIKRSAPSIKINGAQNFIDRKLRIT